jgi:hypothetical protein
MAEKQTVQTIIRWAGMCKPILVCTCHIGMFCNYGKQGRRDKIVYTCTLYYSHLKLRLSYELVETSGNLIIVYISLLIFFDEINKFENYRYREFCQWFYNLVQFYLIDFSTNSKCWDVFDTPDLIPHVD